MKSVHAVFLALYIKPRKAVYWKATKSFSEKTKLNEVSFVIRQAMDGSVSGLRLIFHAFLAPMHPCLYPTHPCLYPLHPLQAKAYSV